MWVLFLTSYSMFIDPNVQTLGIVDVQQNFRNICYDSYTEVHKRQWWTQNGSSQIIGQLKVLSEVVWQVGFRLLSA